MRTNAAWSVCPAIVRVPACCGVCAPATIGSAKSMASFASKRTVTSFIGLLLVPSPLDAREQPNGLLLAPHRALHLRVLHDGPAVGHRSEEHTSELQSLRHLV